jgi:predicted AlkP superfamily phosphohydrolase/phosphomutase
MKLLVIGIDGGDKRIIEAMDMPKLKTFLTEGICLNVEEDLWSRGWAEILGGVHGRELGAFYAKPKLDGTHRTTQKFSVKGYDKNPSIVSLWTRLSKRGYVNGFMNVPSMMPAPKLNGFAVSGGGAGASTSGSHGIPDAACFPKDVKANLDKIDYILDTRFMASGIKEKNVFFNRLEQMQNRRTEAFVQLSREYKPEFGFVAYMATTRIQYLAMSEIEALIKASGFPSNEFQEAIIALYKNLDKNIANLVDELQPEHIMFVADHGGSPRLYSMNLNAWLKTIGFQKSCGVPVSSVRNVAKSIAQLLPSNIKRGLGRAAPGVRASVKARNVDWDRTVAFSVRYIPGIYINDRDRFGGPVSSKKEIESIARRIINEFNTSDEAREYDLNAHMYRNHYKDAFYEALQPDIWIDHPDSIFFEQHGKFVEANKDYGPIKSLRNVDRDQYTGIKRRYPLLCVDRDLANLVDDQDEMDLTLAYKLIVRAMDA